MSNFFGRVKEWIIKGDFVFNRRAPVTTRESGCFMFYFEDVWRNARHIRPTVTWLSTKPFHRRRRCSLAKKRLLDKDSESKKGNSSMKLLAFSAQHLTLVHASSFWGHRHEGGVWWYGGRLSNIRYSLLVHWRRCVPIFAGSTTHDSSCRLVVECDPLLERGAKASGDFRVERKKENPFPTDGTIGRRW